MMTTNSNKHKVNLSAELSVPQMGQNYPSGQMPNVTGKNGKPISMSSITYDRLKGLTPVGGKAASG